MGFIDVLCCIFCIDVDVALINEREIVFISLLYWATLVENERNTITITWIHLYMQHKQGVKTWWHGSVCFS